VQDDEGYQAVAPRSFRRADARRRLTSPLYWVAVVGIFAVLFVIEAVWGGRWALVPICLGPVALALVDRRLARGSTDAE